MSHDTWIHRAARIVARPLARTRVTPNQVTTARLLTGMVAAALFALGDEHWRWWALLAFGLSMLCDRLDGELARLTGRSSAWGHRYDQVTDAACNCALFVGIGLGESGSTLGPWALVLGVVSGAFIALILHKVVQFETAEVQPVSFGALAGFDPDDFIALAPLATALGWGAPLLVVATMCLPIAALIVHLKLRRLSSTT